MTRRYRVATCAEVPEGCAKAVLAGERILAIVRLDGEYHAFDNTCPHRGGSLANGELEGEMIVCPVHGWRFNVKTGQPDVGVGVATYPVRIEDDAIEVEIEA